MVDRLINAKRWMLGGGTGVGERMPVGSDSAGAAVQSAWGILLPYQELWVRQRRLPVVGQGALPSGFGKYHTPFPAVADTVLLSFG